MTNTKPKPTFPHPDRTTPLGAVGDVVTTRSGYTGAISRVHTGQLSGMYDIRLERGSICVAGSDLIFSGGSVEQPATRRAITATDLFRAIDGLPEGPIIVSRGITDNGLDITYIDAIIDLNRLADAINRIARDA
jgi:hypothetical protein